MQDDTGQVQRGGVPRIGLDDRVVAQEGLTELALLMQVQRPFEFSVDAHGTVESRGGKAASLIERSRAIVADDAGIGRDGV